MKWAIVVSYAVNEWMLEDLSKNMDNKKHLDLLINHTESFEKENGKLDLFTDQGDGSALIKATEKMKEYIRNLPPWKYSIALIQVL